MKYLWILAFVVACSATQQAKVVADGQLFCAEATADGPLVVALAAVAGGASGSPLPVLVTGMTSDAVAAACKAINGIPVVPPAVPAQAPVVVVAPAALPAAIVPSGVPPAS